MSYGFRLRLADGDHAGSIKTNEANWQVGDTLIGHGNKRFRVTAVVPVERIAEFVDGADYGVLEAEPF